MDHGIASLGTLHPLHNRCREHRTRVRERAGAPRYPTLGEVERDVIAPIAHIKLGLAQELVGLPSDDVVEHRHLRVPVRQVEEIVIVPPHPAPDAMLRDIETEIDLEDGRIPGLKALGEADLCHGPEGPIAIPDRPSAGLGELRSVRHHPLELHPTRDLGGSVSHGTFSVDVLQELDDQEGQRAGRPVVIHHAHSAVDPLRLGIEARRDRVGRPLLPVLGAGGPRGAPRPAFQRPLERPVHGDGVGDGPSGGGLAGKRSGGGEGREQGGSGGQQTWHQTALPFANDRMANRTHVLPRRRRLDPAPSGRCRLTSVPDMWQGTDPCILTANPLSEFQA